MSENRDLNMTGERVVPEDIKTLEEYLGLLRHLFAYEHVREKVASTDRVLEVGFGEGYGTSMLSGACKDIVGLDVSDEVAQYANNKYGNDHCRFESYDGQKFPFPDGTFDAVVSFQVIEHVTDDAGFVAEIHRVLRDQGRAYITTPNRETRLKPGQRPWNRFHLREYDQTHLAGTCGQAFGEVEVMGVIANDEVMRLEAKRIHQGPLLRLALGLGVRKMIPESLDPFVARMMGRLRGQQKIDNDDQDFKERFSTEDFRVTRDDVPRSLDLFASCRRL
jgi:SAM-dependent methyltransferase